MTSTILDQPLSPKPMPDAATVCSYYVGLLASPFVLLCAPLNGLYTRLTNDLTTCVQWQGAKLLRSQNSDHYLPRTGEYLTQACYDSWEAVALSFLLR